MSLLRTYQLDGAQQTDRRPPCIGVSLPDASSVDAIAAWDAIAHSLCLCPIAGQAEADLRITVAETALDAHPPLGGTRVASDERGTVWRTLDGWFWTATGFRVAAAREGTTARLLLDMDMSPDDRSMVQGYAFRHALTMLLPRTGWMPLHGAGLCPPASDTTTGEAPALLLVGPSGTGKSTLAAGLLQRGWHCISDDLLLLSPPDADDALTAWSLTRTIRLCRDAWQRLGFADSERQEANRLGTADVFGGTADGQSKYSVSPRPLEQSADGPPRGCPSHVIFPELSSTSQSRLDPVERIHALPNVLKQMQPSALLSPSDAETQLNHVATMLRATDIYRLRAGRDLYDDPGLIADLLNEPPVSASTSRGP